MAVPANFLSLPMSYLRASLADCAAFQTWTGAADATAALASIHYISTTPANDTPPLAVIGFGSEVGFQSRGRGSRNEFDQLGELTLDFFGTVSSLDDADEGDEAITFMNTMGGILCELLQRAGLAGHLDIVGLRVGQPMRASHKEAKTAGDFHLLECRVQYRGAA